MTIRSKEEVVRGTVLFTLADTLAAHSIGGYKVGVGLSLRKCRMCLATKEQISTQVYTLTNYKTINHSLSSCSLFYM